MKAAKYIPNMKKKPEIKQTCKIRGKVGSRTEFFKPFSENMEEDI